MALNRRSRNLMNLTIRRVRSLETFRDETKTFDTRKTSFDIERLLSRWDHDIDLKLPIEKTGLFGGKIPIHFPFGDPENPINWSKGKKWFVVVVTLAAILNSALASSLPPPLVATIGAQFQVVDPTQLALPVAIFYAGWIIGPAIFGPLSEKRGRRFILSSAFTIFTAFTLATALTPSWIAFLIFRFVVALSASAPLSIVGGVYADLYDDSTTRGRAMAFFVAMLILGVSAGPAVAQYATIVTWQWHFWVALILAVPTWIALFFVPESYGPILLKRRAQNMRASTRNPKIVAPIELTEQDEHQMMNVSQTRALQMIFGELMVVVSSLYLSLVFAVFFLLLGAYPLIFQGIYDLDPRSASLALVPVVVGGFAGCGLVVLYDNILARARRSNLPWAMVEDYRRLPLACVGCPLLVISLLWLGWSATSQVHWLFPMLAGLPFGTGFLLVFASFLNYLVDAYEIFATSAIAATFCCQSVFGALLPFAVTPLYNLLGVKWATTGLAGVGLALVLFALVLVWCGAPIRTKSKFYQDLLRKREEALAAAAADAYGSDSSVSNSLADELPYRWRR
ncbi:MAG: hypothetical protein M1838_001287 [Thelocarpon superellum]|nr:MAG: hypothetical protein M1838_001287 [Thelocarpon superellum]